MVYYAPLEPTPQYAPLNQYYVPPQLYSPSYSPRGSSFVDRTGTRQDRKRPKYTRSKTGCLTCRRKKVKVGTEATSHLFVIFIIYQTSQTLQCDEGKPGCQRCVTGQFEVRDLSQDEIPCIHHNLAHLP